MFGLGYASLPVVKKIFRLQLKNNFKIQQEQQFFIDNVNWWPPQPP